MATTPKIKLYFSFFFTVLIKRLIRSVPIKINYKRNEQQNKSLSGGMLENKQFAQHVNRTHQKIPVLSADHHSQTWGKQHCIIYFDSQSQPKKNKSRNLGINNNSLKICNSAATF